MRFHEICPLETLNPHFARPRLFLNFLIRRELHESPESKITGLGPRFGDSRHPMLPKQPKPSRRPMSKTCAKNASGDSIDE